MSNKDFYMLGSKLLSSTLQAHPRGLREFSNIEPNASYVFDEDRLSLGDYSEISFPVSFQQEYGSQYHDILDTGHANLYLVSNRLKETLEENEITGWKTFPISLKDRNNREIEGYSGFSVVGRCGFLDFDKSTVIEKKLVKDGVVGKYYKGLYFELEEWDGSDIFVPKGTRYFFTNKKTMNILKKAKISNLKFQYINEIEIMDTIVKQLKKMIN